MREGRSLTHTSLLKQPQQAPCVLHDRLCRRHLVAEVISRYDIVIVLDVDGEGVCHMLSESPSTRCHSSSDTGRAASGALPVA